MKNKVNNKVIAIGIIILAAVFLSVIVVGNIFDKNDSLKIVNEDHVKNPNANTEVVVEKSIAPIQKFKSKKVVKVLLIGDETAECPNISEYQNKWMGKFQTNIEQKYGIKLEIKSVTGYAKNAFGAWLDYSSEIERSPEIYDMAIISVGRYDTKFSDAEFALTYESLVRKILKTYPGIQVIAVADHSVNNEQYFIKLKEITDYYKIMYADTREAYKESGKTAAELDVAGGYPNVDGCDVYAKSISKIVIDKIEKTKQERNWYLDPIKRQVEEFDNNYRVSIFQSTLGLDKKVDMYGRRYSFSERPGDFAETYVRCSILGLYALGGPDRGIVKVYINDVLAGYVDLWMPIEGKKQVLVASGLGYGVQRVRLEITDTKNASSRGNKAYIFGLITNTREGS